MDNIRIMNKLKQVHAHNLKTGIDRTRALILQLLQMMQVSFAQKLFDEIPQPSVFLYNKLIQAHSSRGRHHQPFSLYIQMCSHGCRPNQYTFTFLFTSSAFLPSPLSGQMLHAHFVRSGFESDIHAVTSLIDMYAKLNLLKSARNKFEEIERKDIPTWNSMISGYGRVGDMIAALKLFNMMPVRNVVSWTAMISGYAQDGQYAIALAMFLKMEKEEHVRPNEVTIASVLPACANLGALETGKRIETYARRNNYFNNIFVSNAVLEMYAKCGRIDTARRIFDEIGRRRNLCSWNSMIMGLAIHGSSYNALQLFNGVLEEGVAPDDVTFVGVLLACTHGGMTDRGRQLFKSMERDFSISPKLEHYGCMVDLLGRAGEIREAHDMIQSMSMKPDAVIWGALLGACSFHGQVEIAEKAAGFLFELEPWNPGNYVILSNIYAAAGKWGGVARMRKLMKGGQITKAAGYSFIEEGGEVHKFIVEDRSHTRSDDIYEVLNQIMASIKPCLTANNLNYEDEFLE